MDQLLNHAVKYHHVSNGQLKVPLVIRTAAGGGRGYGATHSQSLEPLLISIPGLKIVYPSTPYDAKGLLKAMQNSEDLVKRGRSVNKRFSWEEVARQTLDVYNEAHEL